MLMARSYNKPARAAVPTDVVLEMVEPLDRVRGQVQGLSSTTDRSPPIPAGLLADQCEGASSSRQQLRAFGHRLPSELRPSQLLVDVN